MIYKFHTLYMKNIVITKQPVTEAHERTMLEKDF